MGAFQPREINGRYVKHKSQPSEFTLSSAGRAVSDSDPSTRAAAIMDPDCSYEDLSFAAKNDTDPTVRLCAAHFVPEETVNDANPFVRLVSYHYLGEEVEQDAEASRLLDLIAA